MMVALSQSQRAVRHSVKTNGDAEGRAELIVASVTLPNRCARGVEIIRGAQLAQVAGLTASL